MFSKFADSEFVIPICLSHSDLAELPNFQFLLTADEQLVFDELVVAAGTNTEAAPEQLVAFDDASSAAAGPAA